MRTNYITTLTEQTRCRIFNDTTTYMASHFFCYLNIECAIAPNADFVEVDSVKFNVNTTTRKQGTLWVYEGSRTFNDVLFLVISNDGEYKMFYGEDYEEVKRELRISSSLKNEIYEANVLKINKVKRDNLFVFDTSNGLLANKTNEEIAEFFVTYGRVESKFIAEIDGTLKTVTKWETDYYYMIENIVYNKKFLLNDLITKADTDRYVQTERVEVTLENLNFIEISANGRYIKKGDSILKLSDKYNKDKKTYIAERYVVKENVNFDEDIMAVLKEACICKLNAPNNFTSMENYLEELIKKDIFHLFSM